MRKSLLFTLIFVFCFFSANAQPVSEMTDVENKIITDTAVFKNFIENDPLYGNNGLPMSPSLDPDRYGSINIMLDDEGNAVEATVTSDISYFEGKYYLYGPSFAYGSFDIAPGANMTATLDTVPASFYRAGGLCIYESDDLMNWHLVSRVFPQDSDTGRIYLPKKTRVVYSEKTGLYTMWFGNSQGSPYSGTWIMQSETPYGPWTEPRLPDNPFDPTHENLLRDFDIGFDENGDTWMVKSHGQIDLYHINEEGTGIDEYVQTGADTSSLNGGIGIHYQNGWWYITGDRGGGNPISSTFAYIMAKDPHGPWISPDTDTADQVVIPSVLAGPYDAGYAQANGSSTVYDMEGNLVNFIPFKHYISSPEGAPEVDNPKQPGDANMALAGQWFYVLEYDNEGHILPMNVEGTSYFPLAEEVETTIPDAYQAALHITNSQSVLQTWNVESDEVVYSVRPSIFQRTPDKGPGRAPTQEPQEPRVNAPLIAELTIPSGDVLTWEIDARTVRWAPQQIVLNLPEPVTGGGLFALKLSTSADNGGYGVAVGPAKEGGSYCLISDTGDVTVYPQAGMMLKTFSEKALAPIIVKQPESVVTVKGSEIGFVVEAEGVGLGYQWFCNDEIILAPDGYNEADTMNFRYDKVTPKDNGIYKCLVFNTEGSIESDEVILYVMDIDTKAELIKAQGKEIIKCTVTNNETNPVDIAMITQWDEALFDSVKSGDSISYEFVINGSEPVILGDVEVHISENIDGHMVEAVTQVHYGVPLYNGGQWNTPNATRI